MKKSSISYFVIFLVLAGVFFSGIFVYLLFSFYGKKSANLDDSLEPRSYHILVIGNYENAVFLKEVFNGANGISERFNSVVELYVPSSQAQNESLQSLFDYASFVNADGVIAYIDSADIDVDVPCRTDGTPIPLITIGTYSPVLPQVSYIGNSNWELGKIIAEEAIARALGSGTIFVIADVNQQNANFSTLMNSFQNTVSEYDSISYVVLDNLPLQYEFMQDFSDMLNDHVVFVALSEDDTIRSAQTLSGYISQDYDLIGFGSNETTQILFNRGTITELISLAPQKIGELAITELFEYKNTGYANNYITAEVQVRRTANDKKKI